MFEISAVSREGLRALTFALAEAVEADRASRPAPGAERIVLRPTAVDDSRLHRHRRPRDPAATVVRGDKPERWVRQTAFDNDEAVGYLADRLARLGVEDELARIGAERGAAVTIGDVTFDFEPTGGVDDDGLLARPPRRATSACTSSTPRAGPSDRLAAKKARHRHDGWDEDGADG